MNGFYVFASEHPIATVVIVSIVCSALVRLAPWRKRGGDRE